MSASCLDEARNHTEVNFYEDTAFACGTRTQLSDNYTSMVRDPYEYVDLWLEGDVHVHVPADENDAYEKVQFHENNEMTFDG